MTDITSSLSSPVAATARADGGVGDLNRAAAQASRAASGTAVQPQVEPSPSSFSAQPTPTQAIQSSSNAITGSPVQNAPSVQAGPSSVSSFSQASSAYEARIAANTANSTGDTSSGDASSSSSNESNRSESVNLTI